MQALTHASGFIGFLSMVLTMNFNLLCCGAVANLFKTSAEIPVLTIQSSALGIPVDHGKLEDFCCEDASRRCSSKCDGVRLLPGDVPRPLLPPPDAEALDSATHAGGKVNIVSDMRADDAPGRHSQLEIVSLRGSQYDVTRLDT